jgi:hypothetical protein
VIGVVLVFSVNLAILGFVVAGVITILKHLGFV